MVSAEAKDYINAHGGMVFVRSHPHRCCRGTITLLDTTTEPPSDIEKFKPVEADVIVRYRGDPVKQPHVLSIEIHGVVRKRLVSYWDGCVYEM